MKFAALVFLIFISARVIYCVKNKAVKKIEGKPVERTQQQIQNGVKTQTNIENGQNTQPNIENGQNTQPNIENGQNNQPNIENGQNTQQGINTVEKISQPNNNKNMEKIVGNNEIKNGKEEPRVLKALNRVKNFFSNVKSEMGRYYLNFRLITTVPLFSTMLVWGKWVDHVTAQLNELSEGHEFIEFGKTVFRDLNKNLYKEFKEKYFPETLNS